MNHFSTESCFIAELGDLNVRFSNEDKYSRRWFYPRYAGGRLHEEFATRIFVEQAKHSNVIADVGANLGWFTYLAAKANPMADVFAFEMDADNAPLCRTNIALNELYNVHLIQSAVSNCNDGALYNKPRAGGAAGLSIRDKGKVSVPSTTMDMFFANGCPPDLMKIDVEGAEQRVLEGMQQLMQSGELRTILIEIHRSKLREFGGCISDIGVVLAQAGFAFQLFDHRKNKLQVHHAKQWPLGGDETAMLIAVRKCSDTLS